MSPSVSSARAHAAIAMRVSGAPLTDIAQSLGYDSPAKASSAIEQALAATVTPDDLTAARSLYYTRLDRLLQAVWPRALDQDDPEQIPYVKTALAIEERRARLMGADAPTRHEVYTPTAEQIQAHVQAVLAHHPTHTVEAEIVHELPAAAFEDSTEEQAS